MTDICHKLACQVSMQFQQLMCIPQLAMLMFDACHICNSLHKYVYHKLLIRAQPQKQLSNARPARRTSHCGARLCVHGQLPRCRSVVNLTHSQNKRTCTCDLPWVGHVAWWRICEYSSMVWQMNDWTRVLSSIKACC